MSKQYKLTPDRFKQAEYVRNTFAISPEDGTPFEALLEPAYWSHIAAKLRPTDRIEVLAEDQSYFAEFIVTSASRVGANMVLLRKIDLSSNTKAEPSAGGHRVIYAGVKAKWRVSRVSDKATLKEGFENKQDAEKWLAELEKNNDLV